MTNAARSMCQSKRRRRSSVMAMDLPEEVWDLVSRQMTPKDWAKACGTSRASYALRPLIAVDVCSEQMRQLQLNRWHACQSLFINLWQLKKAVEFHPVQLNGVNLAGSTLRCLHIIGRDNVPLMEDSMESHLLSLLGRRLSVLTLQVKAIIMPLDLPHLQHLVLDLNQASREGREGDTGNVLFPALSALKSLTTLYVQCRGGLTSKAVDLTGCKQLQCVGLQAASFEGLPILPAGCSLHVTSQSGGVQLSPDVAKLVSGLTAHHNSHVEGPSLAPSGHLYWSAPQMCSLKRLQLVFQTGGEDQELQTLFPHTASPGLEVLEINRQGSLAVCIDTALALKSLILIATGTLQVNPWDASRGPMTTLKKIYFKSGAPFIPWYRVVLKENDAEEPWAGVRLLDYIKEEQDGWTAEVPASFQVSSVPECCCNACPECIARAGVPILGGNAWTKDGFEKHLRPREQQ